MKNKLIIIVLVLAATACQKAPEEKKEEVVNGSDNSITLTEDQLKTMEFSLTQIEHKSMDASLKLTGKVDAAPADVVSVTSALGGYVKKINILPGTNFSKGQILAVLEDNQFIQLQQDYLTAQVQLETARLNFERQKELNQSKAASDKVLQQAEAEYKTLKVTLKALEGKLRLIHLDPQTVHAENIKSAINIYAPFSGTVSQVMVNTGKYISPSETLFELVNPSGLLLNIKAFEKDLSALKLGQELDYFTLERPNEIFKAKVISIGKTVNTDGSTDVLARSLSGKLMLGMFINAQVNTVSKQTPVLPEASVVMYENKPYVFEQKSNLTFEMKEVQAGIKHDGFVEIINYPDLDGKSIVEKGAYTLLMGLKNKAEE